MATSLEHLHSQVGDDWDEIESNEISKSAMEYWEASYPYLTDDRTRCQCSKECDESCFNRCMEVDCHETICRLGRADCSNREFSKLQTQTTAPVCVLESSDGGLSLCANRYFEEDELILEYLGRIVTMGELVELMGGLYIHIKRFYIAKLDDYLFIDATQRGNNARFADHSCEPNCMLRRRVVQGMSRLFLQTTCSITKGEKLTFDYGTHPIPMDCLCGKPNCRRVLAPMRCTICRAYQPPCGIHTSLDWIKCDTCTRWQHLSCVGIRFPGPECFACTRCTTDNIVKRGIRLKIKPQSKRKRTQVGSRIASVDKMEKASRTTNTTVVADAAMDDRTAQETTARVGKMTSQQAIQESVTRSSSLQHAPQPDTSLRMAYNKALVSTYPERPNANLYQPAVSKSPRKTMASEDSRNNVTSLGEEFHPESYAHGFLFRCSRCHEDYKHKKAVASHNQAQVCHPIEASEMEARRFNNPKRPYICSWPSCTKQFKTRSVRDYHFRAHERKNGQLEWTRYDDIDLLKLRAAGQKWTTIAKHFRKLGKNWDRKACSDRHNVLTSGSCEVNESWEVLYVSLCNEALMNSTRDGVAKKLLGGLEVE